MPETSALRTPETTQIASEATGLSTNSIVMKPTSPSVICDLPGELVLLRNMPIVTSDTLGNSLLMRIPHSVKHIFNPTLQDIQLQPGRHDSFSQELFRCEFAYLANILEGEDPDHCDIIIRLVHSSARRTRDEYTTRLLQTITIMLGNELTNYINQRQELAKRNKKSPNYYRPYVRKDKKGKAPKDSDPKDETSKNATPPPESELT